MAAQDKPDQDKRDLKWLNPEREDRQWVKQTLDLEPENHWQAEPGYNIVVIGRGAVRFDVPEDWIFEPDETSFKFFDGKPPDDNCRLECSYNLLPEADWSQFPLKQTLEKIAEDDKRNVIARSEVFTFERQTAQVVWTELRFIDTQEAAREAYSRICIGLGSNVQCLITFDYWADEAERMAPVWNVVLKSLTLGLYIRDPLTGAAFPD
jgi:hypothetical protein